MNYFKNMSKSVSTNQYFFLLNWLKYILFECIIFFFSIDIGRLNCTSMPKRNKERQVIHKPLYICICRYTINTHVSKWQVAYIILYLMY